MSDLYETHPLEHADVERREPDYSTGGDYPFPGHPDPHTPGPAESLAYLPASGRRVPVAVEPRELVTLDYGEQSAAITLDGSGNGEATIGPVPANQWWILDNVIANAAAAGNVLVYLDSSSAPGAVVWADTLAGPGFWKASGPANYLVKPGRVLVCRIVGGGVSGAAFVKVAYRIAVYRTGEQVAR